MKLSKWTKPLHFRGDRRDFEPGGVGPNILGEVFEPLFAEYDSKTDSTTIHYAMHEVPQ